jgi:hypothetical protein
LFKNNVKIAADGKRKTTYGYKMHANTDEDGFVKKMAYTPGNVHDSKELMLIEPRETIILFCSK